VFNFLSLILEFSSLVVALATAACHEESSQAVAVSGVQYVIQVIYLIFSLFGLSGVYQNNAKHVVTAAVGCYIKGFLSIIGAAIISALGDEIDLGGTETGVYLVAGLISKCG
jgi:FlaA1/EpsC-like NDP-sugar epimerase